MNNYIDLVRTKVAQLNGSVIYIHSNIRNGFKWESKHKKAILEESWQKLFYVCEGLDVWVPAFNYDYCTTGKYDIKNDKSQLGVLSDYFREELAVWRTPVPVFSFAGTGTPPELKKEEIIDPFGRNSAFAYLYANNGLVMFYGTDTRHNTLLHYVESLLDPLIYRYLKTFEGKIIHDIKQEDVIVNFHVRPKGLDLGYDFQKYQQDLLESGILHAVNKDSTQIYLARVDEMVDYFLDIMSKDPFYLLTEETKWKVDELYNKLKRPFLISDFE